MSDGRAAYKLALIHHGVDEDKAAEMVDRAFRKHQHTVRNSSPADYPSRESYLWALVLAELPAAEIDALMDAADQKLAEQQQEDDRLRAAEQRYMIEAEREERRADALFELMSHRHHLDDPSDDIASLYAEISGPSYHQQRLTETIQGRWGDGVPNSTAWEPQNG